MEYSDRKSSTVVVKTDSGVVLARSSVTIDASVGIAPAGTWRSTVPFRSVSAPLVRGRASKSVCRQICHESLVPRGHWLERMHRQIGIASCCDHGQEPAV